MGGSIALANTRFLWILTSSLLAVGSFIFVVLPLIQLLWQAYLGLSEASFYKGWLVDESI
jgi:hypothetical protein